LCKHVWTNIFPIPIRCATYVELMSYDKVFQASSNMIFVNGDASIWFFLWYLFSYFLSRWIVIAYLQCMHIDLILNILKLHWHVADVEDLKSLTNVKTLKWVAEANYFNRRANELESLHLRPFASYFASPNVNTQVGGVTQRTNHVSQHS